MARVPQYERRVALQGLPNVRATPQFVDNSALAQGLSDVGQVAVEMAVKEREQADTTAVIGFDTDLTNRTNSLIYDPTNGLLTKKGKDALGAVDNTMASYDEQAAALLSGLSNDAQRKRAQAIIASKRGSLLGTANQYQYQQIQKYQTDTDLASIATSQNNAALNYADPAAVRTSHQKIVDVSRLMGERNGMSPEAIDVMVQKNTSSMYSDILRRQAASDPYKAQSSLKHYQQYLTADDLTQIGSSIDSKVERLQQKAEMQQLRREAKAERTLAQIDNQAASGLPATDEMWDRWAPAFAGTPLQAEFNERRRGEVEIQKVLGLPDAEQQAFVNKRMADLQEKGGTIQQLSAVNRLQRTIEGGRKLRAEAPIAFAQQREGLATDVYDPSSADATDVMDARLDTLKSMRERYGPQVGIKPLLPQEAAAIGAALERSTPEQQGQILGALRETIADQSAYMGALQQIRPDSPVTAIAGAIQGKQRSLEMGPAWYQTSNVVSSKDAANTILLGESLINKTKQGKASDGKISFQMPSNEDLDTAIDTYVGEAYADRPEAKLLDRQVVRAAYAGRSAGINGGSGTVDTDILDWAVKAGVGAVTKFNDQDTFVPWGMDENDFRLEARRKLVQAVSERNLGPAAMVNSLTLKPLGDGQYLVYRGGRKQSASADGREDLIITIGDGQ